MVKKALLTVRLGEWGRVRFYGRRRTLLKVEVNVNRHQARKEVAVRGDFAVERWSAAKKDFEEVEYSVLDQNDGCRAGVRLRCCYLSKGQPKLHHFIYYVWKNREKSSKAGFSRFMATMKRKKKKMVVDHENEKWWDFAAANLVQKTKRANAEKATAAQKTRPLPRKARS